MNRLFIIYFSLVPCFSYSMEQPTPQTFDPSIIKSELILLKFLQKKELSNYPIIHLALDFLPAFLDKCTKMPIAAWTPPDKLDLLKEGITALADVKKEHRQKEQLELLKNTYKKFEEAAQPFERPYLQRLDGKEKTQQAYFPLALYAYAYTGLALEHYDDAYSTLIKAIKYDRPYIIGGMSLELFLSMAFTLKYEPAQRYCKKHKLILKLKKYLPIKEKIVENAITTSLATVNILSRIDKPNQVQIPNVSFIQTSQGALLTIYNPPTDDSSEKTLSRQEKRHIKKIAKQIVGRRRLGQPK